MRNQLLILGVVIGIVGVRAVPLQAADKADAPFKLRCTSTSTKSLPRGNAAAGKIAFGGVDDAAISISRSMKRFGAIMPIKGLPADDSRKYLFYQGECKAA